MWDNSDWPKRIIFNSNELAEFYKARGHNCEESYTFEPVMNAALREALDAPSRPVKERRILIYGRPNHYRNCFFLIRRALEIWAERYKSAHTWRVVSVGEEYRSFSLPGGVSVEILGKLTLEQYANQLHRAALGVSLMASPHPSYPPLEMAHFGALTLCNNFECKDMTTWHDNLLPISVLDPENLAEALSAACLLFEDNPSVGIMGETRKIHYLKEVDPIVLDRIVALIAQD